MNKGWSINLFITIVIWDLSFMVFPSYEIEILMNKFLGSKVDSEGRSVSCFAFEKKIELFLGMRFSLGGRLRTFRSFCHFNH